MKTLAKSAFYSAMRVLPSRWIGPAPLNGCLMPYYHMVSDETVPHVSELYPFPGAARFKADLDVLARGRRAVTLGEFLESLTATSQPPKDSLLLTFDDGFREIHETIAPILEAKGIPAVFFIITETLEPGVLCFQQKVSLLVHHLRNSQVTAVTRAAAADLLASHEISGPTLAESLKAIPWSKRDVLDQLAALFEQDFESYARSRQPYLTPGQIERLLATGHAIGSHSISHPRYGDIPLSEQLRQTTESAATLTSRFGTRCRAFAFPHTDRGVSAQFFQRARDAGIVDVTFGTSGPQLDTAPASFQRFSMEKPLLPAPLLLARQTARRLKLLATGETRIHRLDATA